MSQSKPNKKQLEARFKKGTSGNPNGRPKLDKDVKKIRKGNQNELIRTLDRYVQLPLIELAKIAKDPKTPSFDILVISIIQKGIKQGNNSTLNTLLDRLADPVSTKMDLSITDDSGHSEMMRLIKEFTGKGKNGK